MIPESLQGQLHSSLSNVELRQVIDQLSRKVDYLFRTLDVQYPHDDMPGYVMQARELVLLDRDAEAVKVVREHTAVGIIEARGIVEDMRRRLMRGPVTPASSAPAQSQQSALAPAQSQQSAASNYSSFTPQTAPTSPPREATSLFGNAEAPRLSANEIWADDEPTAVSQPADPVLANAWR